MLRIWASDPLLVLMLFPFVRAHGAPQAGLGYTFEGIRFACPVRIQTMLMNNDNASLSARGTIPELCPAVSRGRTRGPRGAALPRLKGTQRRGFYVRTPKRARARAKRERPKKKEGKLVNSRTRARADVGEENFVRLAAAIVPVAESGSSARANK